MPLAEATYFCGFPTHVDPFLVRFEPEGCPAVFLQDFFAAGGPRVNPQIPSH